MTINIINSGANSFLRPVYSRKQVENKIISLDEVNDSASLKAILTIDFLKGLGHKPVVHNNGFIVLNLTKRKRLHIWGHSDIPKIREEQAIHDHVFGFRSFSLVGKLSNINYELNTDDSKYQIYFTNQSNYLVEPSNVFCDVKLKQMTTIAPFGNKEELSDFYDIKPWDLHRTIVTEKAATVIHKSGNIVTTHNHQGQRAMVLIPKDKKPFIESPPLPINEKVLWEIIEDALT